MSFVRFSKGYHKEELLWAAELPSSHTADLHMLRNSLPRAVSMTQDPPNHGPEEPGDPNTYLPRAQAGSFPRLPFLNHPDSCGGLLCTEGAQSKEHHSVKNNRKALFVIGSHRSGATRVWEICCLGNRQVLLHPLSWTALSTQSCAAEPS